MPYRPGMAAIIVFSGLALGGLAVEVGRWFSARRAAREQAAAQPVLTVPSPAPRS